MGQETSFHCCGLKPIGRSHHSPAQRDALVADQNLSSKYFPTASTSKLFDS
jgi:hypothetical protein